MERSLSTSLLLKSRPQNHLGYIFIDHTKMIRNALCQASTFTLGCYYRNGGTGFMSMYGSVTDAQVFSRELSDQEMVDMTTCK